MTEQNRYPFDVTKLEPSQLNEKGESSRPSAPAAEPFVPIPQSVFDSVHKAQEEAERITGANAPAAETAQPSANKWHDDTFRQLRKEAVAPPAPEGQPVTCDAINTPHVKDSHFQGYCANPKSVGAPEGDGVTVLYDVEANCKQCGQHLGNAGGNASPLKLTTIPHHCRGEKGEYSVEFRLSVASQPAVRGDAPVPMILTCPKCGARHIDEGEWATKPHKTHQCQSCGHEWRPFEYPTVGVLEPAVRGGDALNHEFYLMNLLAIIHRDGGHYVGKYGLHKAYEDAVKLSTERLPPPIMFGEPAVSGETRPPEKFAFRSSIYGRFSNGEINAAQAMSEAYDAGYKEAESALAQQAGELERSLKLNEFFRDSVGECHLMISRDTPEYQVRKEWEPTDLPPRLQKVMAERDRLREERNEEQAAHNEIGELLLPLVPTDDGTSVSAAKNAAKEIVRLRQEVGRLKGRYFGNPTNEQVAKFLVEDLFETNSSAKDALAKMVEASLVKFKSEFGDAMNQVPQ